jgi:hypothetical protein
MTLSEKQGNNLKTVYPAALPLSVNLAENIKGSIRITFLQEKTNGKKLL